MADTTALKNRIRAAIKANDNKEITGPVLQQTLLDIVDELNGRIINEYAFVGIAIPTTIPPSNLTGYSRVFYLAAQNGVYTNLGGIEVSNEIAVIKYDGSAWSKDNVISIDDEPTAGSNNLVSGDGLLNALKNIDTAKTFDLISGYYKDGLVTPNDTNWIRTDFIEVKEGDRFYLNLKCEKGVDVIGLYDKNKNYISSEKSDYLDSYYIVPSNVYYIRFCGKSNTYGNYKVSIVRYNYIQQQIDKKVSQIDLDKKLKPDELTLIRDLYFTDLKAEATIGGYISSRDGNFVTDENWLSSDYIECSQGQFLVANVVGHPVASSITFYDENRVIIEKKSASTPREGILSGIFVAPQGTSYLRFTINSKTSVVQVVRLTCTDNSIYSALNDLYGEIGASKSGIFEKDIDLKQELFQYTGYIGSNGNIADGTDTNWGYSQFIRCGVGDIFEYNLFGHNAVSCITVYDFNKNVLSTLVASYAREKLSGSKQVSEIGAYYIRFCSGTEAFGQFTAKLIYKSEKNLFEGEKERILDETNIDKYEGDVIKPNVIYTVCNDVPNSPKNGGRNRNNSQAVFLDHFLKGIQKELDIHFENAKDKIAFTSPMYVSDSNENSPNVIFNGGNNINTETKTFNIVGKSIKKTVVTIKHRSTLNSITSNFHPKVLCIGDSVTYGEQATMPNDNYSSNQAYHLICKQLFMKDAIDNNDNGFNITFLGHFKKQNTFVYKNKSHVCKTYHEGIRGISMSSYLNGSVAAFKSNTTNKFSIDAWLEKYRTMDDAGNRLPWSSAGATVVGQDGNTYTIGTLIDSESTLNNIDVCLPSHILIMLGMNGGATVEQYQEMIGIIHSEHSDISIAIGIPDSAGTYFPSLHPNCGSECTFWNDEKNGQGTRHSQQYDIMKNLQSEFGQSSYESQKVYMLPFFFVTPTAEGVSNRIADMPDAEFNHLTHSDFYEHYGWHASTHMNAYGHMNWGYCLYSWLKYTLALEVN